MTALSRTDKTAPWSVKAHYKSTFIEESHDHRDGVCNLPERPAPGDPTWSHWGSVQDGNCVWKISYEFLSSSWSRCACPMCGYDAYWSVPRRKRERMEGRRYCRDGWVDEF